MTNSVWLRVLIITIVTALTIAFARYVEHFEQAKIAATFDGYVDEEEKSLTVRLDEYVRTLNGAAGVFEVSDSVTAPEWRQYVESLELGTSFPGILGVGYIALVKSAEQAKSRSGPSPIGSDLPPIHPDTGLDERFVVQFIEPLALNRSALGLDMGFDPVRRAVAQTARETNTVRLTPPIPLVQDSEKKPGFLLLRPVYDQGNDPTGTFDRETAFHGWTYMPFLSDQLFRSLTAQQGTVASLVVFDESTSAREKIFDSLGSKDSRTPRYQATRQVDIFGRTWTLEWSSSPAFEHANASVAKAATLALGLVVVGLVGLILEVISRREKRIERDVAEKTRELRSKHEETQSILDNAVMSIFLLDERRRILSANQAARELLGNSGIQIGQPLDRTILIDKTPISEPNGARKATALSRPDLKLKVEENQWHTAGGSRRHTLLVHDISEEDRSARRLQENERRWNFALSGAQIGVFDVNLATQTSVVSDTWRDLMQVPKDFDTADAQELFLSRIHPDDLIILEKADNDCIEGRTDRSIAEYRMRTLDGTYRWMKSDAVVVERDSDGTALRLLGSQTDVTELRNTQDALEASRKRFEMVLDQAPIGMALVDNNGVFRGANEALSDMTGYSYQELLGGMRLRDLISKSDLVKQLRQIEQHKLHSETSHQGEYQVLPKSGPPIWGLFSVVWTTDPILNEDVYIVQINDINEKKNVEKIKSEFVATVSHELRTPLTSIKGALGLLSGPMLAQMPQGAERMLEIATSNTNRLTALVNDILDLETISSGKVRFDIAPHCMAKQLTKAIEQMLPFATQHKTRFVVEMPDGEVPALIDPQRTQQVVANLLSNACKFSDANTPVDVRLEVMGDQVLVCVLNSGPPIPEEFRSRIFRPFMQADGSDTKASGGTGLGLNIAKQIVERMDGKIGFHSKVGSPTAFWFTVPMADCKATSLNQQQFVAQKTSRLSVLHLEDDKDFLEIVRAGLQDSATVTSALTVREARRAMRSKSFDVIIVDWELPDGNGSELLDDVERYQPQARIIALSATEAGTRDHRVEREIVKSRAGLGEIVANVVSLTKRVS